MFQKVNIPAPVAKKKETILSKHGDERIDPYFWLKERENEEVIEYLNAENAYKEALMGHTKEFQEKLFQELKGRIKEDDQSVPYKDSSYYYITRFEKGQEYPIYARKKETLEAAEEIMLNVNDLAKDQDYYNVGSLAVSTNNQILAFSEDKVSRRIYTIRFKNLVTGELLEDQIPNTSGEITWANDNQTIFYTLKNEQTLRSYKVMRHRLGTPTADDVEIFNESDETFFSGIYKTKSKKYLVIYSTQTISQEYRILEADQPEGTFRLFHPRERGLEYSFVHFEDKFYIRTNLDAQNFRLMVTEESATGKQNWKEAIPYQPEIFLEDIEVFKDFMVLSERVKGITQIRVRPWEGPEHYIAFPEDAFFAYTSVNRDFDTTILRLGYQSMKRPATTYDYHMVDKTFKLLKQMEVLGGFSPDDYETERLYATGRDGQEIPISLVYPKGYEKNGNEPLLLYAYGSYGHSMEPYFSSLRLSLLNRGIAYAIAHIRGGQEMGRQWYEDGKLLNKKNTFYDFIDCADHLVKTGYTNPEKLFAMGGSAGGLLMGAVVNMRPDLWKGVVAAVPFVDVVTTMLDDSIPLTTFEYDEWGNPNDKTFYEYIKSYSPYDNVEAKEYPAMLVTTGLHDSQVQYWEPAKWVARLRELKTDNNPLLLHTNMEAGHGGASGRFRRLREVAMEYTFILELVDKVK